MTVEQFRELWRTKPFQPFTIHLADGRNLRVEHPEFLAMSPSGRTFILYQPDDSFNIVDLLLVTDLEVKKNGQTKDSGQSRQN
ncbi:MAG: hypothetical protein IID44_29000 [Planctomycetes bacterium]|nr:hypothetical protein [Planctomycetota bacterium]